MNQPEYIPDPEMPTLKSELVGRIVRTRVTVERADRFIVRPGTLCKVSGWFRGLSIAPLDMPGQSIRRVPLLAVELMKQCHPKGPNAPDECVNCRGSNIGGAYLDLCARCGVEADNIANQ